MNGGVCAQDKAVVHKSAASVKDLPPGVLGSYADAMAFAAAQRICVCRPCILCCSGQGLKDVFRAAARSGCLPPGERREGKCCATGAPGLSV